MKRSFLSSLGLEADVIDKIIDANNSDIEREKNKTEAAKQELDAAKASVGDAQKELADYKASVEKDDYKAKYEAEVEAHRGLQKRPSGLFFRCEQPVSILA